MHSFQLSTRSKAAPSLLRRSMQIAVIGISSIAFLSGCQASKGFFGKFNDGSLAYQDSEKLEPLQLPADQETAPFVPLYPTPPVGANTLELENEAGKRFKLPAPYRQVPTQQKQQQQ
ncbi:hypothetical protein [Psychrobacter sp. FDAARGOS_221]|uniref:hypothetical protein n=1 Tax=Psychrobacter sp. FDAARGOS_221 TaxID=1975705 RepID=UPI000BB574B9|nr:hypothetical protein [Psychrobacter sp. FDAARGOS_221]PNK61034.1 hypothetical protein A6J60_009180 [Psychrobacter sp. FDAARGOS_221]